MPDRPLARSLAFSPAPPLWVARRALEALQLAVERQLVLLLRAARAFAEARAEVAADCAADGRTVVEPHTLWVDAVCGADMAAAVRTAGLWPGRCWRQVPAHLPGAPFTECLDQARRAATAAPAAAAVAEEPARALASPDVAASLDKDVRAPAIAARSRA